MPDRRPAAYACEDDARSALLAVRAAVAGDDAAASGAACLSMRWHRSGGPGLLVAAGAARVAGDDGVDWISLQDGLPGSAATAGEARLHRELYVRRTDVEAIVRCRPTFATALACSKTGSIEGIPAFHPDVALAAGGAVAAADCGLPGTALQPGPVLAALRGHWACLLAGWGLLACGASLPAAAARAAEVEALARLWWHVLQVEPR
jgi:hypothetical protein